MVVNKLFDMKSILQKNPQNKGECLKQNSLRYLTQIQNKLTIVN
jgi:hypothetical protein